MPREVLGSMQEALVSKECLLSTYCIHKALRTGWRGRACLQVSVPCGLSLSLHHVRQVQLRNGQLQVGRASCKLLVWSHTSPSRLVGRHRSPPRGAFPERDPNVLGFGI